MASPGAADTSGIAEPEIRFALVMNGGVSLAVWMGGATLEIDRLRRGDGVWDGLLKLMRCSVRVDVIAGASAGGLNGAMLGLAIANRVSVEPARQLWLDKGDFASLVRDPLDANPPSILRGDDFFLQSLRIGFAQIASQTPSSGRLHDRPLHVDITATPFTGEWNRYRDVLGSYIADENHRALFTFERSASRDDFADADIVAKLALAGRTTASFPVAFEPSWVPVESQAGEPPTAATPDASHPNMRGLTSFPASRWAMDGGVLMNTPFPPALDAIRTQPAEGKVRRVLTYVVPSPGTVGNISADARDQRPKAFGVVRDALSTLPRVESHARELDEIDANNEAVDRRAHARQQLLSGEVELISTANALLPAYRQTRARGSMTDIENLILANGQLDDERRNSLAADAPNTVAIRDAIAERSELPWLPGQGVELGQEKYLARWDWGLAPVQHSALIALEVLRGCLDSTWRGERPETLRYVERLRGSVHAIIHALHAISRRNEEHWTSELLGTATTDPLNAGTVEQAINRWLPQERLELAALEASLATILLAANFVLALTSPATSAPGVQMLGTLCLPASDPARSRVDAVIDRLLAVDVVQRTGGANLDQLDQRVDLLQLSADCPCAWDPSKLVPSDKLTGLQLNHFGAFYKRSWRANDWMWGRLDACTRLAQVVLDPRRLWDLAQAQEDPDSYIEEFLADIEGLSVGEGAMSRVLSPMFAAHRSAVRAEVARVVGFPTPPPAGSLPECSAVVQRRLQLEVITEELPMVADAVHDDARQGASLPASPGVSWATQFRSTVPSGQVPDPSYAANAFLACPIAGESLRAEAATDRFAALATQAAATVGSLMSGTESGVSFGRGATKSLRGLLLATYMLVQGTIRGGRATRYLSAVLLALGISFLVLAATGVPVPGVLVTFGFVVLIAGFLLSAIRAGGAALVVLAEWIAALILVVTAAYVATRVAGHPISLSYSSFRSRLSELRPALVVAILIVLFLLLALMPPPNRWRLPFTGSSDE